MSISSIALGAITEQSARLAQSAASVSRIGATTEEGNAPQPDLANEAVVRIEANAAIRANINVIREEDERLGYLIDTLA